MNKLDFAGWDETDFEEFCFRLLDGLDRFHNVDWRKGTPKPTSPADRGRDIVAEVDHFDVDGRRHIETWFVDCKHYSTGVPPEAIQGLLAWAFAERPHVALIIASGWLSNPCKDYLRDYEEKNRPPFRIRYWERPILDKLTREAARGPHLRGPHLVFAGSYAATRPTVVGPAIGASPLATAGTAIADVLAVSGVAGPPSVPHNHYVYVEIANDPGERVGECAQRAVARIAFLDDHDKPLIPEMTGRWAETLQRLETGRLGLTTDESQLDIDANGLRHSLDIAMKVPADPHFYAFNQDNSSAPGLRLDTHRIDAAKCRVRVTVRAANAKAITRTFLLRNAGIGGGLSLEDTDEI